MRIPVFIAPPPSEKNKFNKIKFTKFIVIFSKNKVSILTNKSRDSSLICNCVQSVVYLHIAMRRNKYTGVEIKECCEI